MNSDMTAASTTVPSLLNRGVRPPCYLCHLDRARHKYHQIRTAFLAHFPRATVAYSYKTNYVPALCRSLHQEGAFAEVVSGLEYALARRLGVSPERIVFNGTGRSRSELAEGLAEGAIVNLDALEEVTHTIGWAREHRSRRVKLGLRINVALPRGLRGRHHSRFGLSLESGELDQAATLLRQEPNIELAGLHVHLSSGARDLSVFRELARSLARVALHIGSEGIEYLDIGGGFGHAPPEIEALRFPTFSAYAAAIREELDRGGVDMSDRRLFIEPGIALIGDCVSFLAHVVALKNNAGRDIAVIDASVHALKPGRHAHPLPALVYGGDGTAKISKDRAYDIVGNTCMEDDYVGLDMPMPELEVGDIIHFDAVGAYTLVLKPPFTRAMPAVYAVDQAQVLLSRPPETFEQFFAGYSLG